MSKEKQWKNHKNEIVPNNYVSGYDKRKEVVCNKLISRAKALSTKLSEFKDLAMTDADQLLALMYKEYHMEPKKDTKGNLTFFNFDKSLKIEVKVQDIIDFDDRISLAQDCIKEFLELKTQGADADLSTLVNSAFTTSKGRLDKNRVLSLFQLKIKHPLWDKAMGLIKDSITTNNTKRYISFYERIGDDRYKLINLNFSSF